MSRAVKNRIVADKARRPADVRPVTLEEAPARDVKVLTRPNSLFRETFPVGASGFVCTVPIVRVRDMRAQARRRTFCTI